MYSPITKTDTVVIQSWSVSTQYERQNLKINPGIDLQCDTVYSICNGCIVYIGEDPNRHNKKVVLVQYTTNLFFLYANLLSVSIHLNDIVATGQLIGSSDHFVHFETLQLDYSNSQLRIFIYDKTYYKIDPTPYATGSIKLNDSYDSYKYSPW